MSSQIAFMIYQVICCFIFSCCCFVPAVRAEWSVSIKEKNKWDHQSDYSAEIIPRIQYKADNWYAHLEWDLPIVPEPEDGEIELQTEYSHRIGLKTKGTLKHELYFDVQSSEFAAELTPKLYVAIRNNLKIGFDLEIDYLKKGIFDLYELEIEPTIKWHQPTGPGMLALELEAPVFRLYSSNKAIRDFEFETVELIITYDLFFNKKTGVRVELDMPYDVQQEELAFEWNMKCLWQF